MMQADTWFAPDDTDELAELGPPLAEFRPGGRAVLSALGAPVMFLLGWGFVLGPVFFVARGQRGGGALAKLIGLGVLLVAAAVVLFVRALRNRGLRVLVYPEGLVRLQRDRAEAFFWEEIDKVQRHKADGLFAKLTQNSLAYTVSRRDGREVRFDEYLSQLPELGEVLERQTLPHLLARARESLDAGERVGFEKVLVSREGLSDGKETVAWDEVKEVRLDAEHVTVHREGRRWHWLKAARTEMPNAHVFEALVQPLLGERLVRAKE